VIYIEWEPETLAGSENFTLVAGMKIWNSPLRKDTGEKNKKGLGENSPTPFR